MNASLTSTQPKIGPKAMLCLPQQWPPPRYMVLQAASAHQVSQDGALLCARSCLGGGTGCGSVRVAHTGGGRGAPDGAADRTAFVNMECPASGETRLKQDVGSRCPNFLPGSSLTPLSHLQKPAHFCLFTFWQLESWEGQLFLICINKQILPTLTKTKI